MNTTTRTRIGVVVSLVAVGALLTVWLLQRQGHGEYTAADVSEAADSEALQSAADRRVFFAHQSVGGNIIDGFPAAFDAAGLASPRVVEVSGTPREITDLSSQDGGFFAHTQIGENGDPLGKLEEYDAWMRSGMAEQVDVAAIKLCYIDFTADTDADAVFNRYQSTVDGLQRDYPEATFVAVTTPLTTEPGLKTKAKALLGGSNPSPGANAARERFNTLVRDEYGTRAFDVAAFESTAPDGTRVEGSVDGKEYFALYDGYAVDEGHLAPTASAMAAARFMTFLAGTGS